MEKKKLFTKANWFKREADMLLRRSRLLPFLARYGKVEIRGSYALNLMLTGDIDIYVVNSKITKAKVLKAFNALAKGTFFYGVMFYDYVRVRRSDFPRGYYLGLRRNQGKTKWKIDIWFMQKPDAKSDRLMRQLQARLNDRLRHEILERKAERDRKSLNITSAEIYRSMIRVAL